MTEQTPQPYDEGSMQYAYSFGRKIAGLEERDAIGWNIRSLDSVNRLFLDVIQPVHCVNDLCNTAIHLGAPPIAVRLMGYERALRELLEQTEMSSGINVMLGRQTNREELESDAAIGITRVPGNILESQTWIDTHSALSAYGYSHAGLVLWDPQAGLGTRYITDSLSVYNRLLSQAFELVSPNYGVMLAEIPLHIWQMNEFDTWMEKMYAVKTSSNTPLTPDGQIFLHESDWLTMKIVKTPENLLIPQI